MKEQLTINRVSKRIKFQIVPKLKGQPSEQRDKIALLIKYKSPYLTVEIFFSILIAIGPQTKRANKKLPKEDKSKNHDAK